MVPTPLNGLILDLIWPGPYTVPPYSQVLSAQAFRVPSHAYPRALHEASGSLGAAWTRPGGNARITRASAEAVARARLCWKISRIFNVGSNRACGRILLTRTV